MTPEVAMVQLIVIKAGLKLLAKGIQPNRGWTKTKTLAAAARITGKPYKRNQIDMAIADLQAEFDRRTK